MIYTPTTKKALKLCFDAHKDQVDKGEAPYVFHPFHLAEQTVDEDETVVALLHDAIEDTDYTLDDLKNMGFSDAVCEALSYLTHDDSVPYMEYIRKIKKCKLASTVKLADLKHNCDLTRLDLASEKDLSRIEKYKEAIKILEE